MAYIPQQEQRQNSSSNYLLDDVDLFSTNSSDAAPSSNCDFAVISRTNSLIDSPVPNLLQHHQNCEMTATTKLIDLADPPPPSSSKLPANFWTNTTPTSNTNTNSNSNFVESWPELPSVGIEQKFIYPPPSHRSNSNSTSSSRHKEALLSMAARHSITGSTPAATNGYYFFTNNNTGNHVPSSSSNGWPSSTTQQQQSSNLADFSAAVPPKIESSNHHQPLRGGAAPVFPSNGFAAPNLMIQDDQDRDQDDDQDNHPSSSSVRYHRFSSSASVAAAENHHGHQQQDTRILNGGNRGEGNEQEEDEEEEDEDEVFIRMAGGGGGEDPSVLTPLTGGGAGESSTAANGGNRRTNKKKVRFFENDSAASNSNLKNIRTAEHELLVGGGSSPAGGGIGGAGGRDGVTLRKGRSCCCCNSRRCTKSRVIVVSMALATILALSAALIVLLIYYIPPSSWRGGRWAIGGSSTKRVGGSSSSSSTFLRNKIGPSCGGSDNSLDVEYVGNVSLSDLYPTSALTSIRLRKNAKSEAESEGDAVIVFGYGSTVAVPCYGSSECGGGVAAIGIGTGAFVWRRPTLGHVNGVNCRHDLNADGVMDCLVSGKRGVLLAVNGATGQPLWDGGLEQRPDAEFFLPQFVPDMDNDGAPEVLATAAVRNEGHTRLYLLSGKTGRAYLKDSPYVLSLKNMDTSVPSMVWRHRESLSDVIISAGAFTTNNGVRGVPGGVYNYALQSLLLMRLEQGKLIYNSSVLAPPVFADLNGDSFGDMIFCTRNGQLWAVDGVDDGKVLWTFKTQQRAECASAPVIGFLDEDSLPDVTATFCFGDGFPSYRYCETIFIKGKTGEEMVGLGRVRSSLPPASSGLAIGTNSKSGGDVFLIWKPSCGGDQGMINYRFLDNAPLDWRDSGWSSVCRGLFNSRINYQLLAVGPNLGGGGSPRIVFDSNSRDLDEELEKFVSQLEQMDPGLVYSRTKRMVATLQLGPAALFIANGGKDDDNDNFIDLYLPTFVNVAPPLDVVSDGCLNSDDDDVGGDQHRACKMGRIYQQQSSSSSFSSSRGVSLAGGMLLHKLRLRCVCSSNAECANFLPNHHQAWSEYLGSNSDGRYSL